MLKDLSEGSDFIHQLAGLYRDEALRDSQCLGSHVDIDGLITAVLTLSR